MTLFATLLDELARHRREHRAPAPVATRRQSGEPGAAPPLRVVLIALLLALIPV